MSPHPNPEHTMTQHSGDLAPSLVEPRTENDSPVARTAKVRIAVAVGPDGKWCCAGWANADDNDMMGNAIDGVAEGEARYFLTVDLAIPHAAAQEVPASAVSVSVQENAEAE